MPTTTTSVQHCTQDLSLCSKARKRNKNDKGWKRRNRSVIIYWCVIIYVKNPKESTDEILELTSMFNNVARYKIQYVKINCISIYQHRESENEIFKRHHWLHNQKYKVSRKGFNKRCTKPIQGKLSSLLSFLKVTQVCAWVLVITNERKINWIWLSPYLLIQNWFLKSRGILMH